MKKRKGQISLKKGLLIGIFFAILSLLVWKVSAIVLETLTNRAEISSSIASVETLTEGTAVVEEGRDNGLGELTYQGKKYRRNTAVRAILCLGIDQKGDMTQQTPGNGGQADGIFLIAQDAARDKARILMIPRDTMTEITLFDLSGNELGKDIQHLTLQYAYGDGKEKSGEMMAEAVSHLLGDMKIDGYIAVNISAIPIINDAVGGVTVTIEEEGLEKVDSAFTKGNRVTLHGEQAEKFLRYRNVTQAHTAISRMDRQKQYMQAYMQALQSGEEKGEQLVVNLMNQIQIYMVTNMPKDQYLDVALALMNSQNSTGDGDILMLPGEDVETELFDEYHVNYEELTPIILELFYKQVGQ